MADHDKATIIWRQEMADLDIRTAMACGHDFATAKSLHRVKQKIREAFTPLRAAQFKASLKRGAVDEKVEPESEGTSV